MLGTTSNSVASNDRVLSLPWLRLCVGITVAVAVCSCRDSRSVAPEVPPQPLSFTLLPPRPEPPPAEPRDTTWAWIDSARCGSTAAMTILDLSPGEVSAQCTRIDGVTHLSLTLTIRSQHRADQVRRLGLGFCGDVVAAEAPSAWTVSIDRRDNCCARLVDVTWARAQSPSLQNAALRIVGLKVVLKNRWRSFSYSVDVGDAGGFMSSVSVSGGPHHSCFYPDDRN